MATTASELQVLIDTTHAFCDSVGLTISPAKSNVVVFSKLIVYNTVRTYMRLSSLAIVVPYPRLGKPSILNWFSIGSMVSCVRIWHACEPLLKLIKLNKMTAAWAVLSRQYAGMRCAVSVSLVLQLYKTCVPPVASYGCEIWSQLALRPARGHEVTL